MAFGYWAGYVGAALALLHHSGRLGSPLDPVVKESLDAALAQSRSAAPPRALVIGAFGRCGRGAQAALATAGITPTCWGLEETWQLDRAALLEHDILVNAVLISTPIPPFLSSTDLANPARRLTVVSDVTCDVNSACNMLPINDSTTSWTQPVRRLGDGPPPLDIIAIDNLPSLLPREASVAFSADLLPYLETLGRSSPWRRCQRTFHLELARAGSQVSDSGDRRHRRAAA